MAFLSYGVKRREFITTLCAWPLAARGQQPERMRRVGTLLLLSELRINEWHLAAGHRMHRTG